MQSQPDLLARPTHLCPAISLIGMPGAGKSTVGRLLAQELDWAFVDTDFLIEATYGLPLQAIPDALGKAAFLDVEAQIIASVRVHRTILATGGSVVYRESAMQHLAALGSLVFLDIPLPLVEERVALNPARGIAIAPGQSLEDLFRERQALYLRYAHFHCHAAAMTPQECVQWILHTLPRDALAGREERDS